MSKEHPPVFVMRQGDILRPEFEQDAEWIRRQPTGTRIKVSLHTGRSPTKLGFYWSMLSRLVKATECSPNPEALHEAIKLELGYATPVRLKSGMTVLVPGSIAFHKMDEPTFDGFLQQAIRWIAENYGITTEELFAA